jgi:transketolase
MTQAQHTQNMANAIRALAMDAVQQANSGHPGAPMGMAEIAVALWHRHLRHNPTNPQWADRDRFVLSNGHGSMLLYALLHLTGYDLPMEELRNFRQLHSQTPGHPEVGITPGVETTTGPLGQGIANAVGMALAEKLLAAEFNRPDFNIVDHFTYVFLGDGCMMEGISHEVCSLAGTLKLSKLIAIYDDNGISIDGEVKHWFADDTTNRFEAYGWNVIRDVDGHDVEAVDQAIWAAKKNAESNTGPTLICCKTLIGKGAPNRQNTAKAHGEALGAEEIKLTREVLGWPHAPFEIPQDIYKAWNAHAAGHVLEHDWDLLFDNYSKQYQELSASYSRRMSGVLPAVWQKTIVDAFKAAGDKAETVATRKASQLALEVLTAALPEMIGGSADLTGSNLTNTKSTPALRVNQAGRHINFGVREFGMAAIMNGMALHGGFIPYGGTFLTFSDYSRNAIRMAALMRQRVLHVFTHDSIGLGEDGPTHQSVEHAAALRLIPNLDVWRPCDTQETLVAWASAIERKTGPAALLFSRQAVPFALKAAGVQDIAKGAYVLSEPADVGLAGKKPRAVIIATGSEVPLALQAQEQLAQQHGVAVRVVSMPSTNVFDRQATAYKRSVLPDAVPRIAVEAGVTGGWWKYGCAAVVGIDTWRVRTRAGVVPAFWFDGEQCRGDGEKGAGMMRVLCLLAVVFSSQICMAQHDPAVGNTEPDSFFEPGNLKFRHFVTPPPGPSNPRSALQDEVEAKRVAHVTDDTGCKYAGVNFIVRETTGGVAASLANAVQRSLEWWTPDCVSGVDRAFMEEVLYSFVIRPQVQTIYRLKHEEVTLIALLALVDKPTTSGQEVTNVHSHCPGKAIITPMTRHSPNRLCSGLGSGVQGMSQELKQWLAQRVLDWTYRLDLLATQIKLEIPCSKI